MPDSNALDGRFKAVFISPHLDDAVLSCGGTIAQLAASGRVLVLNVFTHYPSSYRKGAINAGEQRYDEEREAARCLGYQSVNLGETDAIFRETTRGSAGRLFRAPAAGDLAGVRALRTRITGCPAGLAAGSGGPRAQAGSVRLDAPVESPSVSRCHRLSPVSGSKKCSRSGLTASVTGWPAVTGVFTGSRTVKRARSSGSSRMSSTEFASTAASVASVSTRGAAMSKWK